MEKSSITMLIGAFLALIVGVSLIGVVATTGNEITNVINVSDETVDYTTAVLADGVINTTKEFSIANPPTTWRIDGCPIAGLTLYNTTSSLTAVDYTFTASTGVITFNNSANVNGSASNTTSATYQYCSGEYLTQGWNRTIINLVPGFFAIALMAVGVGLFYGVMKREGIMGA